MSHEAAVTPVDRAMAPATALDGRPRPLGATWTGQGVNFALFAQHATAVELELIDATSGALLHCFDLTACTDGVWHRFVPAPLAAPGMRYAYRVHGPFAPTEGHRHDPRIRLLDPCARQIVPSDDGGWLGCIRDDAFDWRGDRAPGTQWRNTVVYELHVKGYTMLHPAVPPAWRGKYLGLTVPAVLDHLKSLGVTAVELLPVQAFVSEGFLTAKGLTNYWGYNPIAWYAPASEYAVDDPVTEFREMVRALHGAGIEVILDVVFNHTAEGNELGPTWSMRGIDNRTYYRLPRHDLQFYENHTGCGNTINADHPAVRETILDCLRYWATEMRVDGFRFDLAPVLGRDRAGFNRHSPIFSAMESDPVLGYVKLIAEPWDIGPGGYQLGAFPDRWVEWNDRYRDAVRAFWRSDRRLLGGLAESLAGSSDVFRRAGRRPTASLNFITAHDGFTLQDLVSYNGRHNWANGENNHDGHSHNLSWNCGAEGPTDSAGVLALRARQRRNFLLTLLVSQGVPMLQGGDEFCRTQRGNNNAYCQDNETSWVDWEWSDEGAGLVRFVQQLTHLRARHPELRRDTFLKGSGRSGRDRDVTWLHPAGHEMRDGDWQDAELATLGVRFATRSRSQKAAADHGDLLLLLNPDGRTVEFTLPAAPANRRWRVVLDTAEDEVLLPVFVESTCRLQPHHALLCTAVATVVS